MYSVHFASNIVAELNASFARVHDDNNNGWLLFHVHLGFSGLPTKLLTFQGINDRMN